MLSHPQVLVVSNRPMNRRVLTEILDGQSMEFFFVTNADSASAVLAENPISIAYCDAEFLDGTYRDILKRVKNAGRDVPVIVLTSRDEWDGYMEAMQLGAFDFLDFPLRPADLLWATDAALRSLKATAEATLTRTAAAG